MPHTCSTNSLSSLARRRSPMRRSSSTLETKSKARGYTWLAPRSCCSIDFMAPISCTSAAIFFRIRPPRLYKSSSSLRRSTMLIPVSTIRICSHGTGLASSTLIYTLAMASRYARGSRFSSMKTENSASSGFFSRSPKVWPWRPFIIPTRARVKSICSPHPRTRRSCARSTL